MPIQLNAATRLQITAAPDNKLKNEVMRALTSANMKVDRSGDSKFIVGGEKNAVVTALTSIGWEYDSDMREFTKSGSDYSLAITVGGGSHIALEFIYDA